MADRPLTARQRAFVESYAGNGAEAARKAGYTGTDEAIRVTASRLLTKANVVAAIKAREAPKASARIASREERQAFWTQVMQDPAQKMADRLRAAELLGKSEADFTERLVVKGELTLAQLLEQSGPKAAT